MSSVCTPRETTAGWHSVPLVTRSGLLGEVGSGDSSCGGWYNGEVSLLILISQITRLLLGGLVKRGGESSSGIKHDKSFLGVGLGVGGGDVLSTVVLGGGNWYPLQVAREREPSLGTCQKTVSLIVSCERVSGSALNLGVPLNGPA